MAHCVRFRTLTLNYSREPVFTQMLPPARPNRSAARLGTIANTLIVAGGYLLSRMLGLIRDIIISNQFGTSQALDAFRATFGIIDLIYLVVAGGALGSAFIPVFSGMITAGQRNQAWRLASMVLNLALIGLITACILIGLLAEPLVAATVGSGFDPQTRELTVWLLRLMLLQPILLGLGGIAKATLESFDQFSLPALGANLYNLGIIVGALLAPWLGIIGLVIGVNVGALLFLVIQLRGVQQLKPTYNSQLRFDTPGLAQVGRLIGPRLFGQAIWQINLIAIASFASLVGPGAVAANGYALQLMLLPHGLLALSVGTVIFPQLSRLYAAGERQTFRELVVGALRGVIFVAIPAAAALATLAAPLVRALYERGAFDAASTELTAAALSCYAVGLVGFAAAEILVRTFYALQDTRTPVLVGAAVVAFNIVLGYIVLRLEGGLPGLALVFSLANLLEAGVLGFLLAQRIGGMGRALWDGLVRMLLAGVPALALMAALRADSAAWLTFIEPAGVYFWPGDFPLLLIWLAVVGAIGAGAYAAMAWLLSIPELRALIARIRR